MEWREEGVILGVRRHGETSAIADILTSSRGRVLGLVRGGRSRAQRPVLQPGNIVQATWRARLEDHLGSYVLEPVAMKAGALMEHPFQLAGLTSLTSLAQLLPEREPHPRIYHALRLVLDVLDEDSIWPAMMVRWEMGLLEELGFGLDLSCCAATGVREDLAFVSPRSGRAVSRAAGEPYRDRIFVLPKFLQGVQTTPESSEVLAGLRLTGFFLNRHIFEPRGLEPPEARGWILERLAGGSA